MPPLDLFCRVIDFLRHCIYLVLAIVCILCFFIEIKSIFIFSVVLLSAFTVWDIYSHWGVISRHIDLRR